MRHFRIELGAAGARHFVVRLRGLEARVGQPHALDNFGRGPESPGSTEFAHKYPVATKRVLRAILKAADLCASDPARIAQAMVDTGHAERFDDALQGLSEVRFDVWRDYDPEDTLRFYALRMHEAGMIKSDPQKLIAEHTDWRFLNELKRELRT